MQRHVHTLIALCSFCLVCFGIDAQQPPAVPSLFFQLQSEETTDQATELFLKLGPDNPEARDYLAKRLPALILQEPKEHPRSWVNEVRLAGEFRIREAIPALAKWIGLPTGSPAGSTLAQSESLQFAPAGKALAQIGEPAVPTLERLLQKSSSLRERWVAYRALYLIGSADALTAIRGQANRETDPGLKREIQRALEVGRSQ